VVNARPNTFLLRSGRDLDERLALTIERANSYLRAGADVVFVPGVIDVAGVRHLADAIEGPLNVMAMPGAPDAAALFAPRPTSAANGWAPPHRRKRSDYRLVPNRGGAPGPASARTAPTVSRTTRASLSKSSRSTVSVGSW